MSGVFLGKITVIRVTFLVLLNLGFFATEASAFYCESRQSCSSQCSNKSMFGGVMSAKQKCERDCRRFNTTKCEQGSCLAVWTQVDYEFKISNLSSHRIIFSINRTSYELAPGSDRNFTFPKLRGSNSCNITKHKMPIIRFDRFPEPSTGDPFMDAVNDRDEYRRYDIGESRSYVFRNEGNRAVGLFVQ